MEKMEGKEMRDIRFRAWFVRDAKWLQPHQIKMSLDGSLSTYGLYPSSYEIILCQFTGLLDRHGKEIYEGDVVVISPSEWNDLDEQNTCIVEWFGSGFFFQTINPRAGGSWWTAGEAMEVIGNVYENPELVAP